VERSAAGRFRELLREAVEGLVVGDPFDDGTDVGPLSSTDQWDTVNGYLQIASDERAEVIAGTTTGKRDGGCFVAPTVLAGVDGQSRLVREEIFGPVVVVQEVEGFDEALELANDTEFGLSSALFTRDIARALKFVRGTQSGVVHINRETAGVEPHVPFGGIKGSSSMSREQGKAARQFFTTTKTVYIRPRD
jgi:aldehyde dehydrogenase (NAD+)